MHEGDICLWLTVLLGLSTAGIGDWVRENAR